MRSQETLVAHGESGQNDGSALVHPTGRRRHKVRPDYRGRTGIFCTRLAKVELTPWRFRCRFGVAFTTLWRNEIAVILGHLTDVGGGPLATL